MKRSSGPRKTANLSEKHTTRRKSMTSKIVRACLFAIASFGVANGFAQAQTLKVLHSFGNGTDGSAPAAGLVRDAKGNFYGTTSTGGKYESSGTVFKLTPSGKETVLHNFGTQDDGVNPETGVIIDKPGNLYGTTLMGGTGLYGTVFKLAPDLKETILYAFIGGSDGKGPTGLIRDSKGNFYGTASGAGTNRAGTVFELDTSDKLIPRHEFGGVPDGFEPLGGVVMDSAGNLYGTTFLGGKPDGGTVFKVTAQDKETVLLNLGGADGFEPIAGLLRDKAGNHCASRLLPREGWMLARSRSH
jgi:uncharacterized repeat protein (TIGR03803 family)